MNKLEEILYKLAAGDGSSVKKNLRSAILEGPGFKKLSRELNIPSKSLMRMVSPKGNPTLSNFTLILKVLLRHNNKSLVIFLNNQSRSIQRQIFLDEMSKKYFWWEREDSKKLPKNRILAQIMDLGEMSDTQKMHHFFKKPELVMVLKSAQPGWFHKKNWNYWNLVLDQGQPDAISEMPKRKFG